MSDIPACGYIYRWISTPLMYGYWMDVDDLKFVKGFMTSEIQRECKFDFIKLVITTLNITRENNI